MRPLQSKVVLIVSILVTGSLLVAGQALGDTMIYWTKFSGQQLEVTDVNTLVTTTLENTPAANGYPDSLIFDTSGNLLYTEYGVYTGTAGEIRSFNLTTKADNLVVGGLAKETVDLALDPGGASLLVSNRGAGEIDRVTLPSGPSTTLNGSFTGDGLNGLAYDATGNLWAVNNTNRTLNELDPTTGAILHSYSVGGTAYLDGMTFDPVTGNLFIADGGCMEEMTTLGADLGCKGSFGVLDGVESDGKGDIIVADTGAGKVGQYDISTGVSSDLFSAPGLDDIAPVAGLGAPPPAPEPGSLLLLGIAVSGLLFVGARRLRTA